jgi:hypothetical protein
LQNVNFFTKDEVEQLQGLLSLSAESFHKVIDCLSYTFEQAAFTSTAPEPLYETLLGGGFDEAHAKVWNR